MTDDVLTLAAWLALIITIIGFAMTREGKCNDPQCSCHTEEEGW